MSTTPETTVTVLGAIGRGLPMLLSQFGVCLSLLIIGLLIYLAVTPFRELDLLRSGNAAAATVLGGTLVSLAIPLAALLATTAALLDLVVWGAVAVILQLATMIVVSLLLRGMRRMIEAGQVAGAIPLVAAQLSIGLLNAAAMVPV